MIGTGESGATTDRVQADGPPAQTPVSVSVVPLAVWVQAVPSREDADRVRVRGGQGGQLAEARMLAPGRAQTPRGVPRTLGLPAGPGRFMTVGEREDG